METIIDLSFLKTLSIEIGMGCNLKGLHKVCPAHLLNRNEKEGMTDSQILEIMDQASSLGFAGYFAFHFYNEPLMYADRIQRICKERPNYRYLLWSNGTLIKKAIDAGFDFNIFEKIVFTKYNESDAKMMEYICTKHPNARIYEAEMDNRLSFYQADSDNYFTCKKPYIEMPIDFKGNVYICTYDWKGEYILGNLQNQSLKEFLNSSKYQQILNENKGMLRHSSCIEICKHCPRPYMKSDSIL